MRVAAIDIGTNSVLLLIAETQADGRLSPIAERATITRLGEGVDRTRVLSEAARARTLACLGEYARELNALAPARVAVVGTSAMRDARGGADFAEDAERLLGVRPVVVSGNREAELTFRGALSGLELEGAVAVVDVGGGSTEIVSGSAATSPPSIERAKSLDIGSVRLFERHVRSDPPSPAELEALRRAVDSVLAGAPAIAAEAALVGVAGTVTTLAAIAASVDPYDAARIHGARLTLEAIQSVADRLARATLAERKRLPGLDPRRADVIVAGAVIVERVLSWSRKAELVVSDRGVRWGLAEEFARPTPASA
jgi:exopolyphosphatase/guanosine-5'-triphosphate,3'-diphosphate pyrophosphatase